MNTLGIKSLLLRSISSARESFSYRVLSTSDIMTGRTRRGRRGRWPRKRKNPQPENVTSGSNGSEIQNDANGDEAEAAEYIDMDECTEGNESMNTSQESITSVGSVKRKSTFESKVPRKKRTPMPLSPVQKLNEMYKGLKFEMNTADQYGTPCFSCSVIVNGVTFYGIGASKQEAKQTCAKKALERAFMPVYTPPPYYNIIDFTEDEPLVPDLPHLRGEPLMPLTVPTDTNLPVNAVATPEKTPTKQNETNNTPKGGKNPLMVLNAIEKFNYEVIGQNGSNKFFASVVVNGKKYDSSGLSKRTAKANLAQLVLDNEAEYLKEVMKKVGGKGGKVEGSADKKRKECTTALRKEKKGKNKTEFGKKAAEKQAKPPAMLRGSGGGHNAAAALNERILGLKYNISRSETTDLMFVATVVANGKTFTGSGANKRIAKNACAQIALKELFGIVKIKPQSQMTVDSAGNEDADLGDLPDMVCNLVINKFNELTKNQTIEVAKHKVLAGIIMTRKNDASVTEGEVISLATGTKCISGNYISDDGTVLNDCHAEILSRRGLKRFLYDQLLLHVCEMQNNSIFVEDDGLYRLKDNVFFHLFINTAPCGDGRIFAPQESKTQQDSHPNRRARGQLRTKIENGEGTIPVKEELALMNGVQPWDSIVGGERLLTMSCSDKIARWNILGLQGSLLSNLMKPVYLSSVILGSLFHNVHLKRAIYGRIEESMDVLKASDADNKPIVAPFRLNLPSLAVVDSPMRRKTAKAPSLAVHWTKGDEEMTVVEMFKGKTTNGDASNLCKREFFNKYRSIRRMQGVKNIGNYAEEKANAKEYEKMKSNLYKSLEQSGIGFWVQKPPEVDQFNV